MFIVQNESAVNLDSCQKIWVYKKVIEAAMIDYTDAVTVAEFDTYDQAAEYFSLIMKAYANGDKVFYC